MNIIGCGMDIVIGFLKRIKKSLIKCGEHLDYIRWKIGYRIHNGKKGKEWDRENPMKKIGIVVTEAGEDATAGDYFTALELSYSLEKLGFEIHFIERQGENWYHIDSDIDILISMLESYDVRRLGYAGDGIVKIAWARNWFEAWCEQPWIQTYDFVCASSEKAVEYMEDKLSRQVELLKIGTNVDRFAELGIKEEKYACDYCFTGSYWNEPREIMDALIPENLGEYTFHLYGANWDKIEKFQPYNQGFVVYKELPQIYQNTKILIDDANRVTKPFGSVNSRVFDALASGVLVLTNGAIGAEYTFGGLLPTYENGKELQELLRYYLEHEKEREALVHTLQNIVRQYHSYDHRAKELVEMMLPSKYCSK